MQISIDSIKISGDVEVVEEHSEVLQLIINQVIIPAVKAAVEA